MWYLGSEKPSARKTAFGLEGVGEYRDEFKRRFLYVLMTESYRSLHVSKNTCIDASSEQSAIDSSDISVCCHGLCEQCLGRYSRPKSGRTDR